MLKSSISFTYRSSLQHHFFFMLMIAVLNNLARYREWAIIAPSFGEMDERFKSPPWKGGIGATLSRVRIPLSPPIKNTRMGVFCFYIRCTYFAFNKYRCTVNNDNINQCQGFFFSIDLSAFVDSAGVVFLPPTLISFLRPANVACPMPGT